MRWSSGPSSGARWAPTVPAEQRPPTWPEAIERTLRRLGTDRVDLYQLHRPDPQTPIADTLGALDDLVRRGKVLEIGCSNFSAEQLRQAEAAVAPDAARFVSVQNQYSLVHRDDEREVLPECRRLGLAYLPYFPLASGLLTGKYTKGEAPPEGTRLQRWGDRASGMLTDRNFDVIEALGAWAVERGHSLLDLAFAWLAANDVVASVIAGATTVEQVRANASAGAWVLSAGGEGRGRRPGSPRSLNRLPLGAPLSLSDPPVASQGSGGQSGLGRLGGQGRLGGLALPPQHHHRPPDSHGYRNHQDGQRGQAPVVG